MLETKVYREFCEDVAKVIFNLARFTSKKIKVLQKQMSIGKSFFMGNRLPTMLKEAFPELKFIIRISPTTEVADDDFLTAIEYVRVEGFDNDTKVKYRAKRITGRTSDSLKEDLPDFASSDNVFVFSITHTRFASEFKAGTFLPYAHLSVLLIEEAHQFLAVGDEGNIPYGWGTGYRSPFDANIAKNLIEWADINGRILAFTATPTIHHKSTLPGYGFDIPDTNTKLSDLFDVCNDLASLDDLVETQSWLNEVHQYEFEMGGPPNTKRGKHGAAQDSVREPVWQAIDNLFEREKKLEKLKIKDSNIESKLTGLFMCGMGKGVWGCPIHKNEHHDIGMVEIISEYLLSKGYSEDTEMIATLQEDSGGGNRIWDLSGKPPKTEDGKKKKVTFDEIKRRMLDPKDPLRYLIVINRARSGISIMNLGALVVGVVRDPAYSRTHIPLQIFGRMLRGNPGTGTRFTEKYFNNHTNYLSGYSLDENVDIETVVDTYKVANKFDIWYPKDKYQKTLDVWKDAVDDLKKDYCNTIDAGFAWLHKMTGTKPEEPYSFVKGFTSTKQLLCPHCGKPVYYSKDKMGDGTLLPFFE
jgi:hypothetical protein|tara:strand:- start:83 stop:1831 length:1749 start_codon:yes stop_codon:yes gene_type:complete